MNRCMYKYVQLFYPKNPDPSSFVGYFEDLYIHPQNVIQGSWTPETIGWSGSKDWFLG